MGDLQAREYAEMTAKGEMPIEHAIAWHLQSNHYPPIPVTMVVPCIEAIDAYSEEDIDREITMPDGVLYRGMETAPAWAVVEQHHLEPWIESEEY